MDSAQYSRACGVAIGLAVLLLLASGAFAHYDDLLFQMHFDSLVECSEKRALFVESNPNAAQSMPRDDLPGDHFLNRMPTLAERFEQACLDSQFTLPNINSDSVAKWMLGLALLVLTGLGATMAARFIRFGTWVS